MVWVEEDRALAVAGELKRRRVSCRLQRIAGAAERYTVVVELEEGRQAWWDLQGDGLEARVLRGGVLLGFVAPALDQLSTSGRSGSLADPAARRSQSEQRLVVGGRRRWRPVLWVVLLGGVAVLLVLYLLIGRA